MDVNFLVDLDLEYLHIDEYPMRVMMAYEIIELGHDYQRACPLTLLVYLYDEPKHRICASLIEWFPFEIELGKHTRPVPLHYFFFSDERFDSNAINGDLDYISERWKCNKLYLVEAIKVLSPWFNLTPFQKN